VVVGYVVMPEDVHLLLGEPKRSNGHGAAIVELVQRWASSPEILQGLKPGSFMAPSGTAEVVAEKLFREVDTPLSG